MRRYLMTLKRLAAAGCVVGLGLLGAGRGAAQQAEPAVRLAQLGPPVSAEPMSSDGDGSLPVVSGRGGGPTPPQPEKAKSFWEKNPPIWPLPRTGLFIIPPTGPGYYSLSDWCHDKERENPPVYPYSPIGAMAGSFFNANFFFLEDPKYKGDDPIWDCLHRIHCGDCWLFSTGGEERLRYMNEENSRLSGKDNHYLLERTRVYGDLWYGNLFRAYVEFLDARSTHQNLNPLPIDVDHGDLLNAFVDVNVLCMQDYPLYVRLGRQELLLGSERLVSPLDWANTRRTFQGISAFRQGEKFDVTAFAVQPVGIPNNTNAGDTSGRFASVNDEENFYGVWTTYRPKKGQAVDLYWLDYNNANSNAGTGANGVTGAFNVYTVGSRAAGDYKGFLWDFEGMYQWGHWVNQEISAAAYTTAVGYNLAKAPWNPTYWVSWDWASGNHNPNGPEHGTFNQLFPFNHYYFGQMDLIGRQNIEDFNMQLSLWPTKWTLVNLQYHALWLDSPSDALYSPSGAVLRVSPTGTAGRSVGNLFTITTNFHIDAHQDILVGYSKLAALDFIRNTGNGASPELYYIQYTLRW
jgi:hypothetical protein